jgi:hypothetical protein
MISSSQSSIQSAKKHFATQQIALLSMSNGGGGAARSSSYVKENDIKFGVSVASRQLHTGTVNDLRCRFCLAFGREEKSGSKRKATHLGQAWTSPFRYDNIETHMKNQHAMKWAEYEEAKKDWDYTSCKEQSDSFFENIGNKSSSVKSHFRSHLSPPLGASTTNIAVSMKPSIYIVEKDIVEVIIGDMYYSAPQVLLQQGTIEDNGIDEDNDTSIDDIWNGMGAAEAEDEETSHQQQNIPIFASAAEREAKHANRLANAMQTKQRALSLFEKQKVINVNHNEEQEGENDPSSTPHDENEEVSCYQYVVTIPSTKKLLFDLAIRYMSCGVSFCMTRSIIEHTAEVFGPRITCNRGDISKMARVACASNLQPISDLLKSLWGHSIAVDSATHQSTSYLDLRFRLYGKRNREIYNLHGCALPFHDQHTGKVMHDMLSKFLSVLCPDFENLNARRCF